MPAPARAIPVPPGTEIHRHLPQAYFHDCYLQPVDEPLPSALAIYLDSVSRTPSWVNTLMRTRNRIVSLFGLKDLGLMGDLPTKPAQDYRLGDRVGIFSLLYLSDDEVILTDSDKHLQARVSLCRLRQDGRAAVAVAVSTVVHVHNFLGRAYLFFVVPVHRRIVPAMMARMAAAPR